ncbi:hypothetical protein ACFX15_044660 [Malus domestica]
MEKALAELELLHNYQVKHLGSQDLGGRALIKEVIEASIQPHDQGATHPEPKKEEKRDAKKISLLRTIPYSHHQRWWSTETVD